MSQPATLAEHHLVCDELHLLALEENRHLRTRECAPGPELLTRKRTLLARLDQSLAGLRAVPAASVRDPGARDQLEKTRARILQILQLDQENEQLLLRCSLGPVRAATAGATPPPSVSLLQRIYARCG